MKLERVRIVRFLKTLPFYGALRYLYFWFDDNLFLIRLLALPRHYFTIKVLCWTRPVKLRIGEPRCFEGWKSVSYTLFTPYFFDLQSKSIPASVTDYIILDNVLEHIKSVCLLHSIRNIYKMLRAGGYARIIVPNAKSICLSYLNELEDLSVHRLFALQYNIDFKGRVDILKLSFHAFGHNNGSIVDFQSLNEMLDDAGFDCIREVKLGHSDVEAFDAQDNRSDEYNRKFSLVIECRKPTITSPCN